MPNLEPYCCCLGCGECVAHANEPKRKEELKRLRKVNKELIEALYQIANTIACDYEYRRWAETAIKAAKERT